MGFDRFLLGVGGERRYAGRTARPDVLRKRPYRKAHIHPAAADRSPDRETLSTVTWPLFPSAAE
jgi:hypothetical protein